MSQENVEKANDLYAIDDVSEVYSPGLIIFRDLVEQNIAQMIETAGGPTRLCPHCKTHKTREIVQMMRKAGIAHHKCATIAEAEMLAQEQVENILIAYQLVGPNLRRLVRLIDEFPATRFALLVDSHDALKSLVGALQDCKRDSAKAEVLIDLESGMERTGISIAPGGGAAELYEMIVSASDDGIIEAGGLHWYDGHNRQPDPHERRVATTTGWERFIKFRDHLLMNGFPVPRIVAAGTGSFPILAEQGEPLLQLSPGTPTLHDAAMADVFPEMNYKPALAILTRVVSNNHHGHLTLDVGHKSCAADQPAGRRLAFPALPDAVEVKQTEEHLVISTDQASQFQLGDHLIALPRHACPTVAVHQFAHVCSGGKLVDQWQIAARNRVLTI